jgi:lipopolysaccharide biosynthesis glycosyltransferase
MNNFLYCFDKNYQIPAFCSIYSILENVDKRVNFYLMQDVEVEKLKIPKEILEHKNLNQIFKYKVSLEAEFPNLVDVHVSEATYYRLFIEDYIKEDIKSITYIDCDVICINNPVEAINYQYNILDSKKLAVAVYPEKGLSEYGFNNFGIKENSYFNAGVMIINLQKWRELNLKNKFMQIIENYNKNLSFWDQDVMNIYFNGKYVTLNNNFNYQLKDYKFLDKDKLTNVMFLHYSGKLKPWSIKGALDKNSEYFHRNYRKVFNEKYFLLFNYRGNALRDLANGFRSLSIFRVENSFRFLYLCIRKILMHR